MLANPGGKSRWKNRENGSRPWHRSWWRKCLSITALFPDDRNWQRVKRGRQQYTLAGKLLVLSRTGTHVSKKQSRFLDFIQEQSTASPCSLCIYCRDQHLTRLVKEMFDSQSSCKTHQICKRWHCCVVDDPLTETKGVTDRCMLVVPSLSLSLAIRHRARRYAVSLVRQ